jgi:signal transduction histidine kinase
MLSLAWDMLGEFSLDGRLVGGPEAPWAAALGLSPAALLAAPLGERMIEEDRGVFLAALSLAAASGPHALQTRLRRPDGSALVLAWRLGPSGRPGVCCAAARDVTRLRELQDALLQESQTVQVGLLTLGVVHDFNNILAVIQGCAEQGGGAPELLEAVAAGRELAGLLNDSCRGEAEGGTGDINEAVARSERLLRLVARPSVRLRTRLAPGPAPVGVDPRRLRQLLLNLTVNARDAMPDGGFLDIRTDRAPDGASSRGWSRLTVSDTGVGITPEQRARIFEPFYSTKPRGRGLGLAIVRDIVRDGGGRVTVESRPGGGTSFRVELPEARA